MTHPTNPHYHGQTTWQDNSFGATPSSCSKARPHTPERDYNLDEIAAPPPVYDRTEKPLRRQEYLEDDRESGHAPNSPSGCEEAETEPDQTTVGPEEKSFTGRRIRDFSRTTCVVFYLIIFSLIGTALRLAIEFLTFYPGTSVNTSVLWANVGGCTIMGFLSEDQALFRLRDSETTIRDAEAHGDAQHDTQHAAHLAAHKKTVPLYIGLTAGLCGSLTSFSTFMRDAFLAVVNYLPLPIGSYPNVSLYTPAIAQARAPNAGFSFMNLLAIFFTEIGLSIVAVFLGAHLAICLSRWLPSIPQRWLRYAIDPVVAIIAFISWVAVICLVALPRFSGHITLWNSQAWRGPVLFSLVFAPVGCLLRFYLSLKLNNRIASFPLGTFMANAGGTMVLGMAYSLQHASIGSADLGGGSFTGCEVLQGIMDGFSGCLTTVSTWVLELSDLRRRHAYLYGFASVAVGLCALIVEIGSLKWTRGLTTPSCFAH